jgi:hypothetical protein
MKEFDLNDWMDKHAAEEGDGYAEQGEGLG